MDEDRLGQFANQIAPADSETRPPRFERSLNLNRPNANRGANDNECPQLRSERHNAVRCPGQTKEGGPKPALFPT